MNSLQLFIGSLLRCSTASSTSMAVRGLTTAGGPLNMYATPALWASPMKKKKRPDIMMTKGREDKKKRRIMKVIRRLEKLEGQLKPIEESEVSLKLRNELQLRKRVNPPLSEEERDTRWQLELDWSRFKYQQHLKEAAVIDNAMAMQRYALQELRQVSQDLWFEAVQQDQYISYSNQGPVRSLPIRDYEHPDGDYKDVTRKWNQ